MKVYVLIATPTLEAPTISECFQKALKPFANKEYVVADEFRTLHLDKAGLYTSPITALTSKEFIELAPTKKGIFLAEVEFRNADSLDGAHPRLTKNIIGSPAIIYDAAYFERHREYARTFSTIPTLSEALTTLVEESDFESVSKGTLLAIELGNKIKEAEHPVVTAPAAAPEKIRPHSISGSSTEIDSDPSECRGKSRSASSWRFWSQSSKEETGIELHALV